MADSSSSRGGNPKFIHPNFQSDCRPWPIDRKGDEDDLSIWRWFDTGPNPKRVTIDFNGKTGRNGHYRWHVAAVPGQRYNSACGGGVFIVDIIFSNLGRK